jgi:hypothetical protein
VSLAWDEDPGRLAARVRRLAPGVAVIRVCPDGTVAAYRVDRTRVTGRAAAHDLRIAELLREHYRRVNWVVAHDYYVETGMLRASPRPGRRGSNPHADGTFGSGFGPLYRQGAEIS